MSANQIGFAIGPFENVDLSGFREVDDDDKLGSNAVRVHAFCLPGRASEVRNTCVPLAKVNMNLKMCSTHTNNTGCGLLHDDLYNLPIG